MEKDYIKEETSLNNSDTYIQSTELETEKNTINYIQNEKESMKKRKIGNNIIFSFINIKKVIGISNSFSSYLITNFGMFITEFGWFLSNNSYYSYYIYLFQFIFYNLTIYYMFKCFFSEPGIIPRNNKNYQFNEILNEYEKKYKENQEEYNLNKKKIESIFLKRKCEICKIIKPLKTYHCIYCDNCIKGYDHHNFFISNCIGIRNNKDFFLFSFYGSIRYLIIIIFDLNHIIYVFHFSKIKIWISMYNGNEYLLFISLCLFIIGIYHIIRKGIDLIVFFFTIICSISIFIYLFYKFVPLDIIPSYYNPFSIIILLCSISLFYIIFGIFRKQFIKISSSNILKYNFNIKNEYIDIVNKKEKNDVNNFKNINTFCKKIKNVKKFFNMKIPKSLIDLNNDI